MCRRRRSARRSKKSARFYEDNGALFLTANFLGRRDEGPFISGAVTFVLVKNKLVTVRQIRPRAFEIGQGRASARIGQAQNARRHHDGAAWTAASNGSPIFWPIARKR